MPKETYDIVALPGDGIGVEVLHQALRVLRAAGELFQINFRIEEIECGGHYYAEHEMEWPEGSFEKCKAADAILLGAVGHEINGKTVDGRALTVNEARPREARPPGGGGGGYGGDRRRDGGGGQRRGR